MQRHGKHTRRSVNGYQLCPICDGARTFRMFCAPGEKICESSDACLMRTVWDDQHRFRRRDRRRMAHFRRREWHVLNPPPLPPHPKRIAA